MMIHAKYFIFLSNKVLIAMCIILIIFAHQAYSETRCEDEKFKLLIFSEESVPGNHDIQQDILSKINLDQAIFCIGDTDIESYNWPDQSIVLTENISNEMFSHVTTDLENMLWSHIEHALNPKLFLIVLRNKRIYGGGFTYVGSSLYLPYPVIFIRVAEITKFSPLKVKIKLVIRPYQKDITPPSSYSDLSLNDKGKIENEHIKKLFSAQGKITFHRGGCYDLVWVPENNECVCLAPALQRGRGCKGGAPTPRDAKHPGMNSRAEAQELEKD